MFRDMKQFYGSAKWKQVRAGYLSYRKGLCERCLKRGYIVPATEVHHKVRLTRDNVNDDRITTNYTNLEALCTDCHIKEHENDARYRYQKHNGYKDNRRYKVDMGTGKPVIHPDTPLELEQG